MVRLGRCFFCSLIAVALLAYFSFFGFSGPGDPGVSQYALVIDAGSSGSRLHLYEFSVTADSLELRDELFKPLKPGLSSYAKDPKKGGESIRPLLEAAKGRVPPEYQSTTPVFLGATAGLRMLGEEQANLLLAEAEKVCKEYNFKVEGVKDSFKIMSGVDEGKYAWVAINYLLGTLGKDPTR